MKRVNKVNYSGCIRYRSWEVMESGLGHGKSFKINQMVAAFLTHVHQKPVWRLDSTRDPLEELKRFPRPLASDLFYNHSIKQFKEVMENRHKWSWEVMENQFQFSVCALISPI